MSRIQQWQNIRSLRSHRTASKSIMIRCPYLMLVMLSMGFGILMIILLFVSGTYNIYQTET